MIERGGTGSPGAEHLATQNWFLKVMDQGAEHKLEKEEFISLGACLWDARYNSLARTMGGGANTLNERHLVARGEGRPPRREVEMLELLWQMVRGLRKGSEARADCGACSTEGQIIHPLTRPHRSTWKVCLSPKQ